MPTRAGTEGDHQPPARRGRVAPAGSNPHLIIRQGANLPHWRMDGATYAVTFRLADSLPQETLVRWKRNRTQIIQQAERAGRPLTSAERRRLDELHGEHIDDWLDHGHGSCLMRDPRIARLVRDSMTHFDGVRYRLLAWCVMPNHAHAVLRPLQGHDLSKILLSWKGFTGKRGRELLKTQGQGEFWQKESYDHLVRDSQDLANQIQYILSNPTRAGLVDWPWVGLGSAMTQPPETGTP